MLSLIKPKSDLKTNPQIFDLLQLSRTERDYKILCLQAIHQLDQWKVIEQNASPWSFKIQSSIEGSRLRRRARAAVVFYKMVKGNRIKVFRTYMENLPQRQTNFSIAS